MQAALSVSSPTPQPTTTLCAFSGSSTRGSHRCLVSAIRAYHPAGFRAGQEWDEPLVVPFIGFSDCGSGLQLVFSSGYRPCLSRSRGDGLPALPSPSLTRLLAHTRQNRAPPSAFSCSSSFLLVYSKSSLGRRMLRSVGLAHLPALGHLRFCAAPSSLCYLFLIPPTHTHTAANHE